MTGRGKGRQLRADAQRNHEMIMSAAQTILPRYGPDISMEEVARASGVGVGTLYRRFGNRDALISMVAEAAFQRVMAHGHSALESATDAWQAFSGFLFDSMTDLKTVTCLSVWFPVEWRRFKFTTEERQRRQALLDVLQQLVTRAQDSGQLRSDITVLDIAMMLALTLRPASGQPGEEDMSRRYLTLMLDGLRATAVTTPLPGEPTTFPESPEDQLRQ